MEDIDAANNDEAVQICEYYTLRWYRWGPEGHASKDCLRLFNSRECAEHANELSALEASKRYYWPYSHAEPWEEVNGRGERIFKYSGETYQKIFTVHKTNALVGPRGPRVAQRTGGRRRRLLLYSIISGFFCLQNSTGIHVGINTLLF